MLRCLPATGLPVDDNKCSTAGRLKLAKLPPVLQEVAQNVTTTAAHDFNIQCIYVHEAGQHIGQEASSPSKPFKLLQHFAHFNLDKHASMQKMHILSKGAMILQI
ncbi:TPA: hypothetical protein ACH3X1_007024 [Trebouxia sp. C0004]